MTDTKDIVYIGCWVNGFGHTVCFRIDGVAYKYSVNSHVSRKVKLIKKYSHKLALNYAKEHGRLITSA